MGMSETRGDSVRSFVGFVVGSVAYAVAIERVKEIVNPVPLTPVPHAPSAVAGVVDHRGEVLPIVDLRVRFGLPPADAARRSKWILVAVDGRSFGLMVDGVSQVFGTKTADLRPPPELGRGDVDPAITGVTSHEGVLTFILDVTRFNEMTRLLSVTERALPEGVGAERR